MKIFFRKSIKFTGVLYKQNKSNATILRLLITVAAYPLMTEVLKFEYVKPQNFKHGTTVECARKLGHS